MRLAARALKHASLWGLVLALQLTDARLNLLLWLPNNG
jgi:hypothetical protein